MIRNCKEQGQYFCRAKDFYWQNVFNFKKSPDEWMPRFKPIGPTMLVEWNEE